MLDILRVLVNELQRAANRYIATLPPTTSTCSHEFIVALDRVEARLSSIAEKYGLQRIEPHSLRRRGSDDLAIAFYLAETTIIEVGLRGLNKCGPLVEVSNGKIVAYGRILGPGASIMAEIESEEKEEAETRPLYF